MCYADYLYATLPAAISFSHTQHACAGAADKAAAAAAAAQQKHEPEGATPPSRNAQAVPAELPLPDQVHSVMHDHARLCEHSGLHPALQGGSDQLRPCRSRAGLQQ